MYSFKYIGLGSLGILIVLMTLTQIGFYVVAIFTEDREKIYRVMTIHRVALAIMIVFMLMWTIL